MRCTILWRGNPITVLCTEGRSDAEVTATPVVVQYWFGVMPGLYFAEEGQFGWWYSNNITDVLTSWRVAQLLPRARRLRELSAYDQSLCSLVTQLDGDAHAERRRNLAEDFGVSVDEMAAILGAARQTGPTDDELETILERMGEGIIGGPGGIIVTHLYAIDAAVKAGIVHLTARARELMEVAHNLRNERKELMEADV